MAKTETNYEHFKEAVLMRCTDGPCYDCLAREECGSMCRERGIDSSKSTPPCFEAWLSWGSKPCKKS